MKELKEPGNAERGAARPQAGGGRKKTTEKDRSLVADLERLVEPTTRGDPESPLRWTCKSVRQLADELQGQGHQASHMLVGELLHELGYSLQANRKTREGTSHPDRNAQFEHINAKATAFLKAGEPVISVDTKKKELVGDFKNGGREWRPQGQPEQVRVHDFIDPGTRTRHSLRGLRHRPATRAGSAWAPIMTRRRSRSRASAAGGMRWARRLPAAPAAC